MYQNVIIFFIICFCLLYIGRRFYKQWKRAAGSQPDCGSGCSGCSIASECRQPKNK